jgi:S1-C subfamily serine protease
MAPGLRELSNELVGIVGKSGPGVVRVEARRRYPASGIVWSQDGLVVTAHHVVEQEENIRVGFDKKDTVPAVLVGRDPSTDLAVLRVEALSSSPVPKADISSLQVGSIVLGLGRPEQRVTASFGILTTVKDEWRTPAGGTVDHFIRSSIEMMPGFSGGPLVDVEGRVIGLNTSALLREGSLTIPVGTIERVSRAILEHGRVRRGYLGVGTQPVRLPEFLWERLGQETGLLVVSVEQGSPAEVGGLMLGDVIVALASQPIRFMDDLIASLAGDRVGQTVSVSILRGGERAEKSVTLGERKG